MFSYLGTPHVPAVVLVCPHGGRGFVVSGHVGIPLHRGSIVQSARHVHLPQYQQAIFSGTVPRRRGDGVCVGGNTRAYVVHERTPTGGYTPYQDGEVPRVAVLDICICCTCCFGHGSAMYVRAPPRTRTLRVYGMNTAFRSTDRAATLQGPFRARIS